MNFNGKILIVDDEAHVRKYVSLIARSLGAKSITEAANGKDALARYQETRPDLVLLDVNMPYLDGLGALKAIKDFDPDATVILLTSLTNRQTVEEAASLGATNYIRKDTPRDELSRRLKETIDAVFGDE